MTAFFRTECSGFETLGDKVVLVTILPRFV